MKKIERTVTVIIDPKAWRGRKDRAEMIVREEVFSTGRDLFRAIMDERQRRMRISMTLKRRGR